MRGIGSKMQLSFSTLLFVCSLAGTSFSQQSISKEDIATAFKAHREQISTITLERQLTRCETDYLDENIRQVDQETIYWNGSSFRVDRLRSLEKPSGDITQEEMRRLNLFEHHAVINTPEQLVSFLNSSRDNTTPSLHIEPVALQDRRIVLNNNPWKYFFFGVSGFVDKVLLSKSDCIAVLTDELKGVNCILLRFEHPRTKYIGNVWLSPSQGMTVLRWEGRNSEGDVFQEAEFDVKEWSPGIWYPERAWYSTGLGIEEHIIESVTFNSDIDSSLFAVDSIDLPEGAWVTDGISGANYYIK